jgi:predicted nucleic acid-binding protein
MRYVLDASVAVKWVLSEFHSAKALRLRDDFRHAVHDLRSPDIFPGEVGHALTRAERQKIIAIGEAVQLWTDVMATPPRLFASLPLMVRAILISSLTRVGVFDCVYVALAEQENCELVTADDRLLKNLQAQFPFVIHLSSLP